VSASRIEQIYNGVDTQNFRPARASDEPVPGMPFDEPGLWLVGTVGRMQQVKDQTNLARAFVQAVSASAEAARRLRLVMVGDGPLRAEAAQILEAAGVSGLAWLPGERADVGQIMRRLDCFVLPSIGEGISNTILEAMASALPVIATAVGGNVELVRAGTTGMLVPAQNSVAMSEAILGYFADTDLARKHGCAGRALVERRFSLDAMVDRYQAVYDGMLGIRRRSTDTQLGRSEQLQG
jgi:sugar transferase (PEP-CTERM/EpsH1 system associated)